MESSSKSNKIGWLVSIVTLASSLLFVGSQFGTLQSSVDQAVLRTDQLHKRIEAVERFTMDASTSAVKIATDLEWIKGTMARLGEQRKEILDKVRKLDSARAQAYLHSITIDGTRHFYLKENEQRSSRENEQRSSREKGD